MEKLSDLSVSRQIHGIGLRQRETEVPNLVSRDTSAHALQFTSLPPKTITLPVRDVPITENAMVFQFPHPQIMIDLLAMNRAPEVSAVNDMLAPYLLHYNEKVSKNMIDAIAHSLSYSTFALIHYFVEHCDPVKADEEWKKMYEKIPLDTTRQINNTWKLQSITDLSSLHMLCCTVNLRLILMFPLVAPADESMYTMFSVTVGTTQPKFTNIFVCGSPDTFFLAEARVFEAKVERDIFEQNMERIVLPAGTATYVNTEKVFNQIRSLGSTYESISTHFVVDATIGAPKLEFKAYGNELAIEVRHPYDNLTREQFVRFLSGCSEKFTTTEPAEECDRVIGSFENSQIYSNSVIVQHSTKSTEVNLGMDSVRSVEDLDKLGWAFQQLNFPPTSEDSMVNLYQGMRMLLPHLTSKPVFESVYSEDPPIVMKHTEGFRLCDAANHPFGHFLSLYSLLYAAGNSETIFCKKCHHNRRSEANRKLLMIPTKKDKSPYVKWICIKCWDRMSRHEQAEVKNQYPVFHNVVDVTNKTESDTNRMLRLQHAADRLYISIMSLRSDPVGSLKAVIPRIDNAFTELTEIIKMFRQRMLKLKNVSAADLITIRNSDEYKARVGTTKRVVPLPEPDCEVIDTKLFIEYLKCHTQDDPGVTDYMETLPLDDIKGTLIGEATRAMQAANNPVSMKIEEVSIYPVDTMNNKVDFEIQLKTSETECPAIEENIYNVHFIENNCTVTTKPVMAVRSKNTLTGMFRKESKILATFSDHENQKLYLYSLPNGDCNVDILKPLLVVDDVSECRAIFSADGTSIAVMGCDSDQNSLYVITCADNEWSSQYVGEFEAKCVIWSPDAESTLYVANDTMYWIVDLENTSEEDLPSAEISKENEESEIVNMVISSNVVWAVFSDGECVALVGSNPEEEESEPIRQKLGVDISSIGSCSSNGETGFIYIGSDGSMKFTQSLLSMSAPDTAILGESTHNVKFSFGLFDKTTTSLASKHIAAAISRAFPSLVGYMYDNAFYLVTSSLKSYHPSVENSSLPAIVSSTYARYMANVCVHPLETTSYGDYKVKTVVFMDFGSQYGATFIDAVFGTSFVFAEADGIWTAVRCVDNIVYVIVFFKNSQLSTGILSRELAATLRNHKSAFILARNHKLISDVINQTEEEKPLKKKVSPNVILFLKNAKRRAFECQAIQASLKRATSSVNPEIEAVELIDYSSAPLDDVAPSLKESLMRKLNQVDAVDRDAAIAVLQTTIAQFATLQDFDSIEMKRIVKYF